MWRCRYSSLIATFIFGVLFAVPPTAQASDWPMWRGDALRSGSSTDELPRRLSLAWTTQYSPRQSAWDDPLNHDLMPFERVFEPIVVGQTMLIGFNDSDKLVALDTASGEERWRFYTEGPVRLAPAAYAGNVYFVSDDGYLYCLSIADGSLQWKYRGGPSDRKLIGNRRLISMWPARGAPVIRDGVVYFAASIWPMMGTFIYALDAETGKVEWINDGTGAQFVVQPHNNPAFAGIAPQGPMVATDDALLVSGGRSVPACFDRKTGKFRYYHLAANGKRGGSSVFANEKFFFSHEREGRFSRFGLRKGDKLESSRGTRKRKKKGKENTGVQPVVTSDAIYYSGDSIIKWNLRSLRTPAWEIKADATGDMILAGTRLYAAGKNSITVLQLASGTRSPTIAGRTAVDGKVRRLLAADDKLFAVTLDGRIMAYADSTNRARPKTIENQPTPLTVSDAANQEAKTIVSETGVSSGYALVYGIGDGQLLAALAQQTELTISAVDTDASKIAQLRHQLDEAGLYGARISLHVGDPLSFETPQYMSSLTIVSRGTSGGSAALKNLFASLRPYGGKIWFRSENVDATKLQGLADSLDLANAVVQKQSANVTLQRKGSLPGAADWTHQYGSMANTVKSDDSLVKLPLGVLWFGGSSNMDVLPRHGHGPPEQVVGGRLIIQGHDVITARDVYTGRNLWQIKLLNAGTAGVYFDETHKDTPTSTAYNQVHIPGANNRGTNYVALADRVYVIDDNRCRVLDAETGETLQTISIAAAANERPASSWGYLGIHEDLLIAGAGFSEFSSKLRLPHDKKKGKSKWRFSDYDRSASNSLVIMDRISGKEKWRIDAEHGFIHNGVTVAGDTLYCIDRLPATVEKKLTRRGTPKPDTYRLIAMNVRTGDVLWEHEEDVFGSWLSVSAEHNILLQSTRPSRDSASDENGRRMIAYNATTGDKLWDRAISYGELPILHNDHIIAGGRMYELKTGDTVKRTDPLTGKLLDWSFVRTYGCNYPIASTHMLTFRSSAAGYYDLTGNGGTGNFGGFKSGCTSNLIAADGVLNAPDYTRTCSCSYQNQTSLALVHMPELETWTHNDFAYQGGRVQKVGINFGAPGDRRTDNGTLWIDYPSVGGPSPDIGIDVTGNSQSFVRHSSRVTGESEDWIAASGIQGATRITIQIEPIPKTPLLDGISVGKSENDAEESTSGAVSLDSSDLKLSQDKTKQIVGLRFASVPLEKGAPIDRAYIQFATKDASKGTTALQIYAEAADKSEAFKNEKRNLSKRKQTQTSVEWSPPQWKKRNEAERGQRTSDLTQLVRAVTDRKGWKKNQPISFLMRGSGRHVAWSYDGKKSAAPRLIVELKGASRIPPVVEPTPYTVRMHFMEPTEDATPGERVFDLSLQGKRVLQEFDIVADVGTSLRSVVKEFKGVMISRDLEISLNSNSDQPPVICGIELIAE